MTLTSDSSFPMGPFVVSPSTHPTESGKFRACVAIQRGQGRASHCRMIRFDRLFASRESAHLIATTLGWLQALPQRSLHS